MYHIFWWLLRIDEPKVKITLIHASKIFSKKIFVEQGKRNEWKVEKNKIGLNLRLKFVKKILMEIEFYVKLYYMCYM